MTARTNKAIVRRYIEELNRRNPAILEELVAVEFRDEVLQGYRRNVSAFPDYQVQIEKMIAEGDEVVLVWRHSGRHLGVYEGIAPTGKTITGEAISIYRLVKDKICAAYGVWDQAAIWQQMGLLPDLPAKGSE